METKWRFTGHQSSKVALHALLITLADASASFKQMHGCPGEELCEQPSAWHGRCPTRSRDKQLTSLAPAMADAPDLIMLHR